MSPAAPHTQPLAVTDWLASEPVFYHEKTGAVGRRIQDVFDPADFEFDGQGLRHYLAFGYSVLGRTPVRHVRMLPPCCRLIRDGGALRVERDADPALAWLGRTTQEHDVLDLLSERVRQWEAQSGGEIVIPTSGGFDSRLLTLMIRDRQRVRSFTYGLSDQPSQSTEVVHAQALARTLGTRWRMIELGDYHREFDAWDQLFGPSTHAHGMYQIEFYRKVLAEVAYGSPMLSGIVGDLWAGSAPLPAIETPDDLTRLGYAHGMNADASQCLLPPAPGPTPGLDDEARAYLAERRELLNDPAMRIVELVRFKMVLLRYLLVVPGTLGLRPWSPFLDVEVAMSMVRLPEERRRNRQWQRDFFARQGVDFESMGLASSRSNTLNLRAMERVAPPALDERLLGQIVRRDYVRRINRHVAGRTLTGAATQGLLSLAAERWTPRLARGARERRLEAYFAYLTLKPLDNLLRAREAASGSRSAARAA
ncbi:MAG: hypothetical protein IT441_01725 [Phycisphaeraceae bacterium]|nr:hypothetical protein [Phycisphaeraceae bacterium]